MNELTAAVKTIYPHLEYLRRNKSGQIEFGITKSDGDIEWFPSYQLPYEAERYINEWIKKSFI